MKRATFVILAWVVSLQLFAQAQSKKISKADELAEIKQLLLQQQQRMDEMAQEIRELKAARAASDTEAQQARAAAEQAQEAAEDANTAVVAAQNAADKAVFNAAEAKTAAQLQGDKLSANEKGIAESAAFVKRFRFGGDVRMRYEGLAQENTPNRHRGRFRVRFGLEGEPGKDWSTGFYLATGTIGDDAIATNHTFSRFFSRKEFGVDRAWVSYHPQQARWLNVTAGKFSPTWMKTFLTFDGDLNVEGLSEKLSFDTPSPVVKNVTLVGMQLGLNEVAGSLLPTPVDGSDTYAVGGQLQAKFQFGRRVTTSLAGTALNFQNADSIIKAVAAGRVIGQRNTNATIDGLTPADVVYASEFLYAGFTADTNIDTGHERLPLRIVFDYVNNPRAASDDNAGYYGEVALGRQKEKGDAQLGYIFARIEQDAIISSFAESEMRAGSNVAQHRLYFNYLIQKNVTGAFSAWIGRTLDETLQNAFVVPGLAPGEEDPYQKRIQFDVIYKF